MKSEFRTIIWLKKCFGFIWESTLPLRGSLCGSFPPWPPPLCHILQHPLRNVQLIKDLLFVSPVTAARVDLSTHLCIFIFPQSERRTPLVTNLLVNNPLALLQRVYRLNVGRSPAPLLCTAATDDFSSGDLLQLKDTQLEPDITSAGELWLNKSSPGAAEKNKDYQPALQHHLFITNYLINKESADKGSVIKGFFFFFSNLI